MRLIFAWLLLVFATVTHAQDAPLAADTASRTPAGVTFMAPKSWRLATAANMVTLEAPEGDARIVLVDVQGESADQAVAAAWSATRAEARPLRVAMRSPRATAGRSGGCSPTKRRRTSARRCSPPRRARATRGTSRSSQRKAVQQKTRERLVVPADPAETGKLATRYVNGSLGSLTARRDKGAVVFDVGEWKNSVAGRRNDDGTVSFITIDPTIAGFEFVVGARDGKRVLVTRDAQHEYVFTEHDSL
jgi:hypothetical protein